MADIEPFDLTRAQAAVRGAKRRMAPIHERWRLYQAMWRYGDLDRALDSVGKDPGELDLAEYAVTLDVINMIMPHLQIIEGSVTARNPKHLAIPIEGGERAELAADVASDVLAYLWHRLDATPKCADAVHDSLLIGNGFNKIGWVYDREEEERDELDVLEEWVDLIRTETVRAEMEGRPPAEPEELLGEIQLTQGRTIESEPFVEYVSPFDILVDEAASSLDDCRWVAQRIRRPIEEIKANDSFDKQARDAVSEVAAEHDERPPNEGTEDKVGQFEMADVYEFYDMRARRMLVFQLGAERALYDDDIPYSNRHTPFVHFRNRRTEGTDFWGFGEVELIAAAQRIHNEMWTEQADNARRSGAKHLFNERYNDGGQLEALLESGLPDAALGVSVPDGVSMEQIVATLTREPLEPDVFQAKVDAAQAMLDVLGVNEFQAGGSGADRMSATAAALVDGVASIRADEKAAMVERGVARAGQILLLLAQEFLDEPRAIRMSGLMGAEWAEVSSEDLFGEFTVSVEGGSMRAVNPNTREERGVRLLSEILPIVTEYGFDPLPVLRMGVRDLGFDPDRILVQAQPPAVPDAEGLLPGAPAPEGEPAGAPPADVGLPGNPAVGAQLGGGIAL